ncbi:MAG: hypothetical protein Q8L22_20460, partial [Reyranella sp.]|nr:hypothetical protein [Reyranella sp.]
MCGENLLHILKAKCAGRSIRASLAFLLVLIMAPSLAHAELVDRLVDAFVKITESPEIVPAERLRRSGIVKWTVPIEFNVVGAPSSELSREVEAHMARLAQLSGLQIRQNGSFLLNKMGIRQPVDTPHT